MKTLRLKLKTKEPTTFFTKCLGLYFMLMLCDIFNIAGMGTLLKFYAVALLALAVFYLPKASIVLDKTFILQIAYLIVCLCSIFYSINSQSSLSSFITLLLNFGLVILCQSIEFSSFEVDSLKKSLVWGGVFVLLASLFFADFSEGHRLTILISGEPADQNYINGYLLFAFSYFVYAIINYSKGKVVNAVAVFLVFLFTFATGSRGALLSLFGIFIVLLFIKLKNDKKAIIKAAIIVVAVLAGLQVILSVLPREVAIRFSLDYIEENGTSSRTEIWTTLLTRFSKENIWALLFGKGLSTSQFYNTYDDHVAHNAFIEVLIGTGFVGLTIYCLLIFSFLQKAWKSENYILFATLCGFIIMCMSLSLDTYKPIFNAFIIIEIAYRTNRMTKRQVELKRPKGEI